MTCGKCDQAAKDGYRFCPACGSPLRGCDMCGTYAEQGYDFCGKCGNDLRRARSDAQALDKAVFVAVPFVVAMLAIEAACMLIWFPETFGAAKDLALKMFVLLPSRIDLGTLTGAGLQAYWVLLVVAIVASGLAMLYQSRAIFDRRCPNYVESINRTSLFWISLMFAADMVVVLIISAVEGSLGYTIAIPEGLPTDLSPEAFLSYANASVWEEVVSRVIPIGIPMAVVAALSGKKDFLRYLLGGTGVTKVAIVLMVVSSIVFGLAHMSGWGAAKVVPMVFSGLIMSYLFVRFGVYASIMFHFLIDYTGIMVAAVGTEIYGFILIACIVLGFISVVKLAKSLKDGVRRIPGMPVWVQDDMDSRRSRDSTAESKPLDSIMRSPR